MQPDPDRLLTTVRRASDAFRGRIGDPDDGAIVAAGALLAVAFDELDNHLMSGGRPPTDWMDRVEVGRG